MTAGRCIWICSIFDFGRREVKGYAYEGFAPSGAYGRL